MQHWTSLKEKPMKVFRFIAFLMTLALGLSANSAELTGTLKKVNDSGTVTLGVRDASIPFSYLDDKQETVGYSVDLCMKVVDAVKAELKKPDLKVVKQVVTSATRIPLIANGTVDIECGSTVNNIDRQKQVAFSVTTFVVNTKLIVKKSGPVHTFADMKGRAIAVTSGANTVQKIAELNTQRALGMTMLNGQDHNGSFALMESDRAAAFAEDDILLAGLAANSKTPDAYRLVEIEGMAADPYALMLRRDDPQFKALVDRALVAAFNSGAAEALYKKWFTQPVPPRGVTLNFPLSEQLRKAMASPTDSGDPKDYR
jgi:glutamate/aspartate transport system substrate-binding protein